MDESRPRHTGFLWRSMVRNFPDGSAWTISILKELVPMSIEAKRLLLDGDMVFGLGCAVSEEGKSFFIRCNEDDKPMNDPSTDFCYY